MKALTGLYIVFFTSLEIDACLLAGYDLDSSPHMMAAIFYICRDLHAVRVVSF
jgi:hypothetical protein